MLENLTISYVNQSEEAVRATLFAFAIFGASVAGLRNRSNTELARAPYFASGAAILLLLSTAQSVWLQSLPALTAGYLWILMVVSIATTVSSGFFYYKIALARSRDAYGHSRLAILCFIPPANLWLLLKRSKNPPSANRTPTIPLLTGFLGILSGVVMLVAAAVVSAYIESESKRLAALAVNEPAFQQASIAALIRSNGLEQTLRTMAHDQQAAVRVDEVTTLTRIEAVGTQLRRTYIVELTDLTITDKFRSESTNGICAWGPFDPILRAGGSIREIYVERGGREIGAVMVTRQECDF